MSDTNSPSTPPTPPPAPDGKISMWSGLLGPHDGCPRRGLLGLIRRMFGLQ
ncbi:hypothetical protein [Deinococcus hopiensis]|uniref:Uncharacterized protein n=1 Tax=Deinococcus hopiensis KR-140 TaxID=695939 RepID=A0A1W1UXJ6_9DEIO|nr:hypothetical protein [Deinococcus hopiensis]SMB85740.1 hypothetical protein SAMN00790413_03521 [Deinococcus hopiensis KR-140]